MKQIWILICLAACFALLASFFPFQNSARSRILLVQDALDPMVDLLEPYAGDDIERLNPYELGFQIPGLDGIAFIFGTQARPYQEQSSSSVYVPLYSASIVIAVNRHRGSAGSINGWRTLLQSDAHVLIPHQGTEGGRLAAIAMAQGLDAKAGDLSPALEASAYLQSQGRLNPRDDYLSSDYLYMYNPDRLPVHDAIILWDYQAKALARLSGDWDIIIPEEGAFSVDCGFIYSDSSGTKENLRRTREFLLSDQVQKTLLEAGFSPFKGTTDLSSWDSARLTYNPDFRRAVLSLKLVGPASLMERLVLQSVTLLVFCFAAQRVLRRIPRGLHRLTSFYSMLFVLFWMIIGVIKALSIDADFTRYCWIATYMPRHILPVCWFCMCYVNRYDRLPPRKILLAFFSLAVFLTLFVFTNDFHQQFFDYANSDPATWAGQYSYTWGFYLSSIYSIALSILGLALLLSKKMTRRQQRQMMYATALFVALFLYQFSYVAGVKHIVDLDIPTLVAILILVFTLAAQRERFMGASLFEIPIFQNSPYAIAIYDSKGQKIYFNALMESLKNEERQLPALVQGFDDVTELHFGDRQFKSRKYVLDTGRALVLEDISDLKRLELSLVETHKKLEAVQGLLELKVEKTRSLTDRLVEERFSRQMEQLFKDKQKAVQQQLSLIIASNEKQQDRTALRRVRFLLGICQQRLRFIIRSLETYPLVPVELVEKYAAGVIQDGRRTGLDGVFTATGKGYCPSEMVPTLLEILDSICLYAFDLTGTSLICRLEAGEACLTLNVLLSWEIEMPLLRNTMLSENLIKATTGLGGQIHQETEEDGQLMRLYFPLGEVQ